MNTQYIARGPKFRYADIRRGLLQDLGVQSRERGCGGYGSCVPTAAPRLARSCSAESRKAVAKWCLAFQGTEDADPCLLLQCWEAAAPAAADGLVGGQRWRTPRGC